MRAWQDILDITDYTLNADVSAAMTFAVIADVHAKPARDVLSAVKERKPDAALLAGDILERRLGLEDADLSFLAELTKLCPVFYAFGNHEDVIFPPSSAFYARIRETGAVLLINESVRFRDTVIGGLHPEFGLSEASETFLGRFEKEPGYRILLCHEPDRYIKYVRRYAVPLVVSGHAHGGQIRIGRQGLFAPQQGFFPQYTAGIHDGRLLISRGLANHTWVPRLWNHRELCFLTLEPQCPNTDKKR